MEDNRDKTGSPKPKTKERLTLYKEYRLIERNEAEISGSWKGTHLLFFFLAFVFGSFCTFCFHVLMYLFDEKCVLFPKLLLLKELRHSVLYDYMPNAGLIETLPVDFVTTHWMDKSTCYLPTYVPLISGIFGLVWTTMFLMFSSGSRTLGLQRSWRLLPPVIIFSVAMGSLCIYTSTVTTMGLMDLCAKLSEITGSTTCSYTINVVTLAFERRIRGVFQAIQLTIISAWLHTSCWVLAAIVALVRVILVIDFRLVCISADLCGNIEKMLERHERHIRTVSPEQGTKDNYTYTRMHVRHSSADSIKVRFRNKEFGQESEQTLHHYFSQTPETTSRPALVPEEKSKLLTSELYGQYPNEHLFIIKILYDALYSALSSLSDDDDDVEPLDLTKEMSNESNNNNNNAHTRTISNVLLQRERGLPSSHKKVIRPADGINDDRQSIIESNENIEWKEVFTRKQSADMTSSLNTDEDLRQLLQTQLIGADQIKPNLKDSAKQEAENVQKQTEQIITPRDISDETLHSSDTLKPYPRDANASATEELQEESRRNRIQIVPNPIPQTDEEVLSLLKSLSIPKAVNSYVRPEEARTSKSQYRQVPAPAAQTEVASKLVAPFESLSVKSRLAIRLERSGASPSQEMQLTTLATKHENPPAQQIVTSSESHIYFSEPERTNQPSRVSRSEDQQLGDLINDSDGNHQPPASTKDEGTQTHKKEKQD